MRPRDIRDFQRMDADMQLVFWKIFEDALAGKNKTIIQHGIIFKETYQEFIEMGFFCNNNLDLNRYEIGWK